MFPELKKKKQDLELHVVVPMVTFIILQQQEPFKNDTGGAHKMIYSNTSFSNRKIDKSTRNEHTNNYMVVIEYLPCTVNGFGDIEVQLFGVFSKLAPVPHDL